jgi:nucleoside-diphosphate-sugar epimerase
MVSTFIIGSGNLSNSLKKKIIDSKIYTAKEFLKKINLVNKKKKINLIINSFYSSIKLKKISSYETFVFKTVFEIAKILDLLNYKIVNKIIYTSSSSVYGFINNKINLNDDNNKNIYTAFKISAESLIENYCKKKSITFIVCRLFNVYGGKDKFSIIQKLKSAQINNRKIIVYNYGKSIRDFIHVEDAATIYDRILKLAINSGLYDVGTGQGIKLIKIIKKLKLKKENLVYKKKLTNEVIKSVADNISLIQKIKKVEFKKVYDYFT